MRRSSGAVRARGRFGAEGSAFAYLVAGCPAVVGNLWDVTDGDIDRFASRCSARRCF
jgi:separase